MDAPDSPSDLNNATGQGPCDEQIQGASAQSTSCVPQSIAERMAEGTLSAEELHGSGRRLVRHLLRGCPDCAIAFGIAAGFPAVTRRFPPEHYDFPVRHGIRRTMQDWHGKSVAVAPRREKTYERERAMALIGEARKLRRDSPWSAIELLDEALWRARKVDATCAGGGAPVEDLTCEILTERGNLFRLLGQHLKAELAFQAALGAWQESAGNPETLLTLGDLYGSFLFDRCRFAESDELLVRLICIFQQRGNVAYAGRLTIKRSLVAASSGDPRKALWLAYEAMLLLKRIEESLELQLNALQLTVAWNVQIGNFQEASECAEAIRTQYRRHMGANDWVKFLWLDAQIYHGLGRHNIAEGLFRRAKLQFQRLGLPFQAALVGLDLAVMLVETRHSAEARELIASELIPTFRSVGVAREGLASLVLLERTTEARVLDAALLKNVLRDLERAGQSLGPMSETAEASDFE